MECRLLGPLSLTYFVSTPHPFFVKKKAHRDSFRSRAPPQILNVSPGQPVELRVVKRLQDNYVPSARAKQGKVFSGNGQRLGSPAPASSGEASSSGSAIPGAFPNSSDEPPRAAANSISTRFEVDQTKPTTNVQIRLADGSRYVDHV